jgi:hypothetical protein
VWWSAIMSEICEMRKKEELKEGNGQIFVSFGLRKCRIIKGIFIDNINHKAEGSMLSNFDNDTGRY